MNWWTCVPGDESTSVIPLSLVVGEAEDKVQTYIDNNNAAVSSCASGFRFDKSPVEAQYDAWKASK